MQDPYASAKYRLYSRRTSPLGSVLVYRGVSPLSPTLLATSRSRSRSNTANQARKLTIQRSHNLIPRQVPSDSLHIVRAVLSHDWFHKVGASDMARSYNMSESRCIPRNNDAKAVITEIRRPGHFLRRPIASSAFYSFTECRMDIALR